MDNLPQICLHTNMLKKLHACEWSLNSLIYLDKWLNNLSLQCWKEKKKCNINLYCLIEGEKVSKCRERFIPGNVISDELGTPGDGAGGWFEEYGNPGTEQVQKEIRVFLHKKNNDLDEKCKIHHTKKTMR